MNISTRIARLEKATDNLLDDSAVVDPWLLGGKIYDLPTPTLDQVVDWLDYERIPEYLENEAREAIRRASDLRPGWYPSKEYVETHVAWCHTMLAKLQRAYEGGEIDADTYAKLTTTRTKQGIVDDQNERQKQMLRKWSWRPSFVRALPSRSDGTEVSVWSLLIEADVNNRITLYRIGDQWVRYPDNVKPYELSGW